jgi:hypothetical protein
VSGRIPSKAQAQHVGGMLVNGGTTPSDAWIAPPYAPERVADYAVEAEIQAVAFPGAGNGVGVGVRAGQPGQVSKRYVPRRVMRRGKLGRPRRYCTSVRVSQIGPSLLKKSEPGDAKAAGRRRTPGIGPL